MKTRNHLLTVSKVLFLAYGLYVNIIISLFYVKGLAQAILLTSLFFALVSTRLRFPKDKSFFAFIAFAVVITVTSAFVAYDFSRAFMSVLTFLEFLVSFLLIIIYSEHDRKIDFALNAFVLQGLVTVLLMVVRGTNALRVSISESVNVNTIGTVLVFSIAFVLFEMITSKKTVLRVVAGVLAVLVLAFGIMLTVSKKSIIAGAALIILWIICCYRTTFMKMKKGYRILLFFALILTGYFVYRWYTSNYATQIEYMLFRMSEITEGDSSQERLELIKEGFETFLSYPVFGVGFNNARYYSIFNTYTHCFYIELLACTGIIGTFIFGYGMVHIWSKIGYCLKRFRFRSEETRSQIVFMIIIYVVLLFYSWTQIIFYTFGLIYPLFVLSAFGSCLINQKREETVGLE